MADKSKIQWCDATINPCYGCWPVSPACDNCYATRLADRMAHNVAVCQYYEDLTDRDGRWTGRVNLFPRQMEQAFRWWRPRRIFLGSMTDLFHEAVPDDFLDQIFAYMALAPRHTFVLLTKRPERMCRYLTRFSPTHHKQVLERAALALYGEDAGNAAGNALDEVLAEGHNVGWPMRHVILMTTVEDQPRTDERMPHMMELAGMGWRTGVSIEPMLGPVDLRLDECLLAHDHATTGERLSWVICGGESGPKARPMHPDWARSLRDQCQAADVPFFFKQWGEWAPLEGSGAGSPTPIVFWSETDVTRPIGWSQGITTEKTQHMVRVGKNHAGRLLDGTTHDAFPEVA